MTGEVGANVLFSFSVGAGIKVGVTVPVTFSGVVVMLLSLSSFVGTVVGNVVPDVIVPVEAGVLEGAGELDGVTGANVLSFGIGISTGNSQRGPSNPLGQTHQAFRSSGCVNSAQTPPLVQKASSVFSQYDSAGYSHWYPAWPVTAQSHLQLLDEFVSSTATQTPPLRHERESPSGDTGPRQRLDCTSH